MHGYDAAGETYGTKFDLLHMGIINRSVVQFAS